MIDMFTKGLITCTVQSVSRVVFTGLELLAVYCRGKNRVRYESHSRQERIVVLDIESLSGEGTTVCKKWSKHTQLLKTQWVGLFFFDQTLG